jgi:tRNA threonylcarbamoyladenosine biosynthesis protein TsaB
MSYILNIESSSTNCSISLSLNGKVISLKEQNDEKYSHSTKLHSFIEQVLIDAKINIKQLSAVAVSKGPGSYTGLRIGITAGKGLCYALGIPLISLSTLLILAKQIKLKNDGLIIPLIDARRNEVYSSVYDFSYNKIRKEMPEIIDENSFGNLASENKLYFIGNGQEKCKRLIKNNSNLIFSNINSLPSSNEMALLSFEKFKNSKFEDIAYFEPEYLKNFISNSQ